MKDINEQIERIKQLFTEERLHGNLVDSKENIDEQDMYKRGRKAKEKEAKAREKRDSFRSTKEKGDNEGKYLEELKRIEKFYKKDRRAFKNKYEYKDEENNKLFPHKDGVGDGARIKLIKFGTKDGSLEERIDDAKKLLKEYIEEKKGIKKYKITQLYPGPKDKVKDSKYVVFSYVPEAVVASSEDNTGKQDDVKQDTAKQDTAKQDTDKQDTAKQDTAKQDTDKQSSEPLPDDLSIQIISKGDLTSRNYYTDEKLSVLKKKLNIKSISNTTVDKDKNQVIIADENGDEIVLKLKESISKKHLLESVYTNSVILEQQFVDQDGNDVDLGVLGDELKALFSDNTQQPADTTKVDKQEPADTTKVDKQELSDNTEEEKWKKYPCVVNNADRESRTDEGDYIIGDKIYHSDGTYTLNGEREGNTYSCKKGKIVHDFDIKKQQEESWKGFPCVAKNKKAKASKLKDGSLSYIINGNRFYNNGRVRYGKESLDYNCKDGKIVIPKIEERKSKELKQQQLEKDIRIVYDHIGTTFSVVDAENMKEVLTILEKYDKEGKLCSFVEEYNLMDNDGILDSLDDVGTTMGLQSELNRYKNKSIKLVSKCSK